MKSRTSLFAALAAMALAAPASAQTTVELPAFDQIELRGGGHVVLRHGPVQRVTLMRGSRDVTAFEVERDDGNSRARLTIDACRSTCRDYDLQIEIVTPNVEALAVRGGGAIEMEGTFPRRADLAVAVTGGGAIDTRRLAARNVAAAVQGGGSILTHADGGLAASIRGGGSIRYWGDAQVTSAVSGGGSVERGSAR